MLVKLISTLWVLGLPAISMAQTISQAQQVMPNQQGRTANSAVGKIGERQTRNNFAADQPIRIASRVKNRISLRVYNRIDRYYQSNASTRSPFVTAEEELRNAGRRKR